MSHKGILARKGIQPAPLSTPPPSPLFTTSPSSKLTIAKRLLAKIGLSIGNLEECGATINDNEPSISHDEFANDIRKASDGRKDRILVPTDLSKERRDDIIIRSTEELGIHVVTTHVVHDSNCSGPENKKKPRAGQLVKALEEVIKMPVDANTSRLSEDTFNGEEGNAQARLCSNIVVDIDSSQGISKQFLI